MVFAESEKGVIEAVGKILLLQGEWTVFPPPGAIRLIWLREGQR